ncbi:MAG: hypothetical protein MAG794_00433 [Gammaproteobacteria bacterium]|nr:hypothetical protein [Gammaproteobacteria bacterium]
MTKEDSRFLDKLRDELRRNGGVETDGVEQRQLARDSGEYGQIKSEAAERIDALYAQIVRDIKEGLTEIDQTVGPIAEPMADELAKGAVSDVFEAAATVLKAQIRRNSERSSSP